jgi:hypothetical protein
MVHKKHMEITTTTINRNPSRRAAVNALAIVGFIALIIIGIGLAIYSARFAPTVASRLGGAAVSLSSVFRPAGEAPSLQVVTATSSIPFADEVTATSTVATTTGSTATGGTHTSTGGNATTYTTVTTTQIVDPYGDPDLTVHITDVGYLRTDGKTNTFVSSNNVPSGKDGAVKFTVTNSGTNVTGSWKFRVDVPTNPSQTFTSPSQESLKPGDNVDYVLGFEKGKKGDNRDITVTVDSGKNVSESNEGNNEDSESIDINS